MIDAALPTFGLMFVLGLRHGVDPDHVAVIDNIVFRAVTSRPRLSGWIGTLFALGHSLSVAAVAIGVSLVSARWHLPDWSDAVLDAAVIMLLMLVGTLNLVSLLRKGAFVPIGWRAGMVPAFLRQSTHPAAVVTIGVLFGLVFDTATQAAAWGAAASAHGGLPAVAWIAGTFALGMVTADTLDSQIVSRLLRSSGGYDRRVLRYRRAVGWLIVALSYGMAGLAITELLGDRVLIGDAAFTAIGIAVTILIVFLLSRDLRRKRAVFTPQ